MVLNATVLVRLSMKLSDERLWQCRADEPVIVQHLSSSRHLSGSASSELALWIKFNGEIASLLLWRGTAVERGRALPARRSGVRRVLARRTESPRYRQSPHLRRVVIQMTTCVHVDGGSAASSTSISERHDRQVGRELEHYGHLQPLLHEWIGHTIGAVHMIACVASRL